MDALTRRIDVGEIRMRIVEQGNGPAVVLCHGFPGLAYNWRHQLPVLAANGFRAIAPDMRGYGGTDRPDDPREYNRAHTVADMVGLLDALEIDRAVFVGHDFGAALVWDLPQWAPGRVRALIQLSVPRTATSPILPSTAYAKVAAEHFLHLHYFQEPGVADAELDGDPGGFLRRVFWALSGGYRYVDIFAHPSTGNGYLDVLPQAPPLPWPWLSQAELDHYVETFTRTGFTGGLNWYRANDHIWHEKQQRPDEPVTVPVCFITGDKDPVRQITGADSMAQLRARVPGLAEEHLIAGSGHFVQMEAPAEVNRIMLNFLRALDS
ncbi:alpha/beta fold hydrolase [Amycolatopsis taiwanensis]|uniref:alpha/beta fold hydrolase n=1 Tax=Amycolatopsis taiwanensis TaxID=342230 RepID=UPI00048882CA|nr:alpha/beta hydrolase [Amycolatopsis taiwanensis]